MQVVNAVGCEPDDTFGQKLGPYHFHHGVEEWLYAVSGAPLLRDPDAG